MTEQFCYLTVFKFVEVMREFVAHSDIVYCTEITKTKTKA